MPGSNKKPQLAVKRRRLLGGLCALGLGVPNLRSAAAADEDEARAAPREDDRLVFAFGPRSGEIVAPADLTAGQAQIVVYPMDLATGVVRDANRLNQTLLLRLDPAMLSEATLARAADGIVAYSGVCTHTGCDVTDWSAEQLRFKCPCHESEFDPSDAARVVGGPAPWQLAALPLKIADGDIAVAGSFEGRLGFPQPGLDPFGGLGGL
jgi:Rieske Fe-S protein